MFVSFQVRESRTGEDEDVVDRRVMAAVWGPGGPAQPATTLVMLDPQVTSVEQTPSNAHLKGHLEIFGGQRPATTLVIWTRR